MTLRCIDYITQRPREHSLHSQMVSVCLSSVINVAVLQFACTYSSMCLSRQWWVIDHSEQHLCKLPTDCPLCFNRYKKILKTYRLSKALSAPITLVESFDIDTCGHIGVFLTINNGNVYKPIQSTFIHLVDWIINLNAAILIYRKKFLSLHIPKRFTHFISLVFVVHFLLIKKSFFLHPLASPPVLHDS